MSSLVLLSGGLDSSVLLANEVAMCGKEKVGALFFQYGQRHNKERDYAIWQARHQGVSLWIQNIENIYEGFRGPMFDDREKIPDGKYKMGDIPSTYIPFRNGIMLSIAAAYAYEYSYANVAIATHQDDGFSVYPDCSPSFTALMGRAIDHGTGQKVHITAPFLFWSKACIAKRGRDLGVHFEHTWSCYEGGDAPCNKCATCVDRNKALEALK